MQKVTYLQFDLIFKNDKDCSLDMVSFDHNLEDFKTVLGFVKRQGTIGHPSERNQRKPEEPKRSFS